VPRLAVEPLEDRLVLSDHFDAPATLAAPQLDLTDLYAFVTPTNANTTTFILAAAPTDGAGPDPDGFSSTGSYSLFVSNDGNPLTDEIEYRFRFGQPGPDGTQTLEVRRFVGETETLLAAGKTGRTVALRGGGRVHAAAFDDPAFANRTALHDRFLRPNLFAPNDDDPNPHYGQPSAFPDGGPNTFAGANVHAIVLEVPRLSLQSSRFNPNITYWAASRDEAGNQVDRTATPFLTPMFLPELFSSPHAQFDDPRADVKDAANASHPGTDVGRRAVVAQTLAGPIRSTPNIPSPYGLSSGAANTLAQIFFPDVGALNTTSRAGFPNGRRLGDDVFDTLLDFATAGRVSTDHVGPDSPWLVHMTFPYLGAPARHDAASAIQFEVGALDAQEAAGTV
jgi:hypothetical protein